MIQYAKSKEHVALLNGAPELADKISRHKLLNTLSILNILFPYYERGLKMTRKQVLFVTTGTKM